MIDTTGLVIAVGGSIPFLLLGLWLVVSGWRSAQYAARSRNWTPAAGTVIASGVK